MPNRSAGVTLNHAPLLKGVTGAAGLVFAAGCLALTYRGGAQTAAVEAGLLGALAVAVWARTFGDRLPSPFALIQTALVTVLYAASADPAAKLWQAPVTWNDFFTLTNIGAGLACCVYLGAVVWRLARTGRFLSPLANAALLALPYLFNLLLALASSRVVAQLGQGVDLGMQLPAPVVLGLGRVVVLVLFNEAVLLGIGLLMDRRWARPLRVHVLILGGSVLAAFTPVIADLGSSRLIAELPFAFRLIPLVAASALAQAGLWAQTFLITGILLDALRGQRPTWVSSTVHWSAGLAKGAIYGGLFMLVVHVAALALSTPALVEWLRAYPVLGGVAAGVLLFPLAKTIVESFDGSAPFFRRLLGAVMEPVNYLRGALAGAGLGFVLVQGLPAQDSETRFVYGFAIGALAYGGADLLWDACSILRGLRRGLQSWRVYALGAVLGGAVAGSLAWYFDAAQVAAVTGKFWNYAAVHYPAVGKASSDYFVYPLFSKWGVINLGTMEGGVRLFYNESLSGVINWSLAAPLFSINLVVLNALFQRSLAPLKELFSSAGVALLVEQAVRVLRWGLWMAPIIYSFLRLAPDPTWYNQDGAVRTVVATLKSWTLAPGDFRAWSLDVFLGLLAYDWLRMLIWFDHMGLRVATLVNLSFVGGDAVDEKAARFLGHSARTRCIPEGIRRFLTWAPLLIPFYIPRGSEWDYVWTHAEPLHASAQALLPAVTGLVVGYRIAALGLAGCVVGFLVSRRRGRAAASRTASADRTFAISNGLCTQELAEDGRGYSRVTSTVRKGYVLDLTRRPDDPLQLRGKFFYLREMDGLDIWSVSRQPRQVIGPDYKITQPTPTSLSVVNSHSGIRAEARVSVADGEPVETWRIRLTNLETRRRTLELTSYQELALSGVDAYRRSPPFAAMHVGTWFVRPLGAILYRNRLLRDAENDPKRQRMSREVGFHAVRSERPVRLVGYEDSRAHFIGSGTLRMPAAFAGRELRAPTDEGLLYTFDPAASLRLQVELAPGATVEVLFVDGYAEDEHRAVRLLAKHLGIPLPDARELQTTFGKTRRLHVSKPVATTPPYTYSPDGKELHLGWDTPRPWTHILANPLGHGAVVSNEGEIFSFAGNAQQNALSPCNLDTVPAQLPAQALYVMDLRTGAVDTPTYIPFRRSEARHEVTYGRGYAVFRKFSGALEYELTLCVPPDQPAELRLLRIRNHGHEAARLRVVPYAEIVLAEVSVDSRGRIETRTDENLNALFFAHPHNDFRKGWAFAATSLACDARETVRSRFVGGVGRDLAHPYFVEHGRADAEQPDDGRRVASFAGTVEVPAGGEVTVTMALGQAQDLVQAAEIIRRYRDPSAVEHALTDTKRWWDETLSVLRIETNMPEFDRLVNDWLPYQLLTSRLWGRTGPSQRSGAYGYRDQLQDVLPLVFLQPQLARQQILLHAAQQFLEGDVLKWWHPSWEGKTGIGVRTMASDPHLWLPYVVSRYVAATGDTAVLEESASFLEGRPVPPGTEGFLFAPRVARQAGSVYEHCRRAVALALSRKGKHGLPLLGSGDWNDGLDVAGLKGRGESVWLGFFLHDVLLGFATLAERCEGPAAKARYLDEAARLRKTLDAFWRDGYYLRVITDDDEEMDAASALMAAWPLLSGAVDLERGITALERGLQRIEKEDRVLLLTPSYTEHSRPYPGRLADYPPGVRENGGQYSHGSSWLVDALLRAAELTAAAGRRDLAEHCRARAVEIWIKISPLSKTNPANLHIYGLPPHQQPADVYDGPGYEGRGGWSWYTGAAARMLSAAYALLGLRMEGGELRLPDDLFAPKGPLQLKRLVYRGKVTEPA